MLLIGAGVLISVVSCNKGSETISTENEVYKLENINFDEYFKEAKPFELAFWEACDKAYQTDPERFTEVCESNDFEQFKKITQLNTEYFDQFKEVLLEAQAHVEADYPGIIKQYQESPCNECATQSLQRIGKIVEETKGCCASKAESLTYKECIFICSMACMTTLELYVPCVIACVKICRKF